MTDLKQFPIKLDIDNGLEFEQCMRTVMAYVEQANHPDKIPPIENTLRDLIRLHRDLMSIVIELKLNEENMTDIIRSVIDEELKYGVLSDE